MQYVPDLEPKRSRMESIRRWIWVGICVVLFGPFALIFLFAITGNPVPDGHFGTWFMGSLTVAGVLSTLDFARGVKNARPKRTGLCDSNGGHYIFMGICLFEGRRSI